MTKFQRYIADFYAASQPDDVLRAAERGVEAGLRVHGAIWAMESELATILEKLRSPRAGLIGLTVVPGRVSRLEIKRPVLSHRRLDKVMQLVLWCDDKAPLIYVMGCQSRDAFEYSVELSKSFLGAAVSTIQYRTKNVLDVFTAIEKSGLSGSIRLQEYTSRTLREDDGELRKVETERHWAKSPLSVSELFERLSANRQWLFSVAFSLRATDERVKGRILRNGMFACELGFGGFVDVVLPALRESAIATKGFFDARDATSSPTGFVRPVRIEYSHDVFAEKSANHRLLAILESFPSSALAVYHPNPYLHASLIDYADGSSYEIWVTTTDAVLVVPRTRASADSLQRLCNFICDEFEEGNIIEFNAN